MRQIIKNDNVRSAGQLEKSIIPLYWVTYYVLSNTMTADKKIYTTSFVKKYILMIKLLK